MLRRMLRWFWCRLFHVKRWERYGRDDHGWSVYFCHQCNRTRRK